jgi:hypothetical protein
VAQRAKAATIKRLAVRAFTLDIWDTVSLYLRREYVMLNILLLAAAAQAVAPAPDKPVSAPAGAVADKPICRRIVETGSFVKGRKICMSREQWARSNQEHRAAAQQVVSDGTGRVSGQ